VFVRPNYRSNGYGSKITATAVAAANGRGVCATSRTENSEMHDLLAKHGFIITGLPYRSRCGGHELQIFLMSPKSGIEQST
jgi:GNAT superfamily N-acetyltransferase